MALFKENRCSFSECFLIDRRREIAESLDGIGVPATDLDAVLVVGVGVGAGGGIVLALLKELEREREAERLLD